VKHLDEGTEGAKHAAYLMRPSFAQHERRTPRPVEGQHRRPRRSILAVEQDPRRTLCDRIGGQLAAVADAVALRELSRRVGQVVDEVAVGRQHEEPGGRPVEAARDLERTLSEQRIEDVEDERRLASVAAAGESDRLVEQEVLDLVGRAHDLALEGHCLPRDPGRRLAAHGAIDPDPTRPDEVPGLAPGGEPRPREVGVKAHRGAISGLLGSHGRPSLSESSCRRPARRCFPMRLPPGGASDYTAPPIFGASRTARFRG